ncbi:MAG: polymerase IV-like protein ImuB, partial [Myxococcaceae bacterium]|nr:polymerase IV-like protein ImuB [Myxococcaceae bacterium]
VTAFDPPRTPRAVAAGGRAMALHVYRPPREVAVVTGEAGLVSVRAGEVRGRVVTSSGPWRVEGGWWDEPYAHEGYDVELDDGGLYLIAYDPVAARWRLDGVYE